MVGSQVFLEYAFDLCSHSTPLEKHLIKTSYQSPDCKVRIFYGLDYGVENNVRDWSKFHRFDIEIETQT